MRPRVVLLAFALLLPGCVLDKARDGNPGTAAEDLVSIRDYDNLVVEIDHPAGFAPNAAALDVLEQTLRDVTQKKRIDIVLEAEIPATEKAYTYAEIEALEDEHRDRRSSGEDAVLYIVYVAGTSSENEQTLGVAYRGTSLAIYKGTIKDNACYLPVGCTTPKEDVIERTVLVHEFGHAAGLVNLGAPMQTPREDAAHPGHSADKGSVMYWAVENADGLLTLFTGGSAPYQFTSQDKADLRALFS